MTEKFEQHYTKEQLARLGRRRAVVGEDEIRAVQEGWKELIAEVRAAMDRDEDPTSAPVRRLAVRWKELQQRTVEGFTGGDPGIAKSLRNAYRDGAGAGFGLDAEVFDYISRAMV